MQQVLLFLEKKKDKKFTVPQLQKELNTANLYIAVRKLANRNLINVDDHARPYLYWYKENN